MLLVWKVAGIPCVHDLIVMVIIGWFVILLYDLNKKEGCISLARMHTKRINRWSFFLFCKRISPRLASWISLIEIHGKRWALWSLGIFFLLVHYGLPHPNLPGGPEQRALHILTCVTREEAENISTCCHWLGIFYTIPLLCCQFFPCLRYFSRCLDLDPRQWLHTLLLVVINIDQN